MQEIRTIRDSVNASYKRQLLLKDSPNWHILCSSMDVLDDTEWCIDSYKKLDKNTDKGICYLILYGILQTFILQQDAIKNIARILLGLELDRPENINKIREIRNSAVGHPVRGNKKNVSSVNFVVRMDLEPFRFRLNSWTPDSDGWHKSEYIDLLKLVEEQSIYIKKTEEEIVTMMIKDEIDHKKKFSHDKLITCFGNDS